MIKILIFGVGNPYKCDDTVGIKVAEILKKKINKPNITVKSGSIDGFTMIDAISGYDNIIFIDSIQTKDGKPGDIYKIKLEQLEKPPSLSASHGVDFVTAIRTGKKLGYKVPEIIHIYAIEIEDNTSFSEDCTEKVKKSIPEVVKRIMDEIEQ
jgi:hydrogenase maturation protease